MEKILDDYRSVGEVLSDFKKEVSDMSNRTSVIKSNMSVAYTFYSICKISEDSVYLIKLDEQTIKAFEEYDFQKLAQSKFLKTDKSYFVKNFGKENLSVDTLILADNNNKITLISKDAYTSMLQRVGLGGNSMLEPTFPRNVLIAEKFLNNLSYGETIVTRQNAMGYSKIMAVLSSGYKKVPQTILNDIIEEIENIDNVEPVFWEVNNRISYIYLSLPDKEKEIADVYKMQDCTPGIYLATSDTGDCSIIARAFFKFGGRNIAIVGEFTRKHEGNIEISDIIKEINTKLFPKFSIIPKKLTELMLIDIKNPEEALVGLLKYIGLTSLVGKKNEISIREQLLSEIDPIGTYTGYDISMMALQIPDRIKDVKNDVKKKLENGIIKAVFYDYPTQQKPVATLQD